MCRTVWTLLVACLLGQANAGELVVGSIAMESPAEMVQHMTPLVDYLSRQTGLTVKLLPSPDMAQAIDDLGSNRVQLTFMSPVAYIDAHRKFHAQPLVATLTAGKATFHLVVVVARDSPFRQLADLRGKRFAFGDPGARLQPAVLAEAGVRADEFGQVSYLKRYDNIARAVLAGYVDGGIMKDSVYEEFAAQGLRTVYTSPPLASYLFAINGSVDLATRNAIRAAFLRLSKSDAEGRAVLDAFGQSYDGFRNATDQDYDNERRLISRLAR